LNEITLPKHNLVEASDSKSSKNIEIEVPAKLNSDVEKKKPLGLYEKFVIDISSGKLMDEELVLLLYILATGRIKLGTGWQEQHEAKRIIVWEEVNEIRNKLSSNYASALGKFEVRGYTEVSAVTSFGNPKEVKLKSEIADNILYLPEETLNIINKAINDNKIVDEEEDLLF